MHISNTKQSKNYLYGSLIIAMLVVFLFVFNRRSLELYFNPDQEVKDISVNAQRFANPWNKIHADSVIAIVKDGDLVLRSGSDEISALFKKVNTHDKTYSHAGIIFIENGTPIVYNCIGSAAEPEAILRRDSLNAFVSPYDNNGYAVYRYAINSTQVNKLHSIAIRYFKEKRTFDPYFDLKTDEALYCTEFVYKAMVEMTGDKKYLQTTETSNFNFVAVDNLFSRKDTKLICKIGYKQ